MKTNRIIINIDKKNQTTMECKFPVSFEDFMTIFCTLALNVMKNMVRDCPKEHQKACRGALYDSFNIAVSKVLAMFAPDMELRPNLTTLAIKEAEDRIVLEGRLNEVEPNT